MGLEKWRWNPDWEDHEVSQNVTRLLFKEGSHNSHDGENRPGWEEGKESQNLT